MRRFWLVLAALCLTLAPGAAQPAKPHNVVLFVTDGLRYGSVTPDTTPTLARLRAQGVDFQNSHSLYPTVTTANASTIATGHYLGDTGNFDNRLYFDFEVAGTQTPFFENNAILREISSHYAGNYLGETSLLAAARKAGYATAVIGKVGPALIQDITAPDDAIVLDDSFGKPGGTKLPPGIAEAMKDAGLAPESPGTGVPNVPQQIYLMDLTTKVLLPKLAKSDKPFVLIFWSRDPDLAQHATKDSIGQLQPGIDGPTGHAGIANADTTLKALLDALQAAGLEDTTNVFVTADHGFATNTKDSATSPSAQRTADKFLPAGFLAADLAEGLKLKLFDGDKGRQEIDYASGKTTGADSAWIGADAKSADIAVVPNSNSDLLYLTGKGRAAQAREIVRVLLAQDYVSGIFVNDALGKIPGTLPMSAIGLIGATKVPKPSIVVNFRSYPTGCADALLCTAGISDTGAQIGQGNHGGFSRAETRNFMAAMGPDFKAAFADPAPVSNADIAPTLARLLGLKLPSKGKLKGRVIGESLKGGRPVTYRAERLAGPPAEGGLATTLLYQRAGNTLYFDAAGFPGRTVGIPATAP